MLHGSCSRWIRWFTMGWWFTMVLDDYIWQVKPKKKKSVESVCYILQQIKSIIYCTNEDKKICFWNLWTFISELSLKIGTKVCNFIHNLKRFASNSTGKPQGHITVRSLSHKYLNIFVYLFQFINPYSHSVWWQTRCSKQYTRFQTDLLSDDWALLKTSKAINYTKDKMTTLSSILKWLIISYSTPNACYKATMTFDQLKFKANLFRHS